MSISQSEENNDGEEFVALPETDWQLEDGLSQGSQGTEPFAALDRRHRAGQKRHLAGPAA